MIGLQEIELSSKIRKEGKGKKSKDKVFYLFNNFTYKTLESMLQIESHAFSYRNSGNYPFLPQIAYYNILVRPQF